MRVVAIDGVKRCTIVVVVVAVVVAVVVWWWCWCKKPWSTNGCDVVVVVIVVIGVVDGGWVDFLSLASCSRSEDRTEASTHGPPQEPIVLSVVGKKTTHSKVFFPHPEAGVIA